SPPSSADPWTKPGAEQENLARRNLIRGNLTRRNPTRRNRTTPSRRVGPNRVSARFRHERPRGSSNECDTPCEQLHAPTEGEEMTGQDPAGRDEARGSKTQGLTAALSEMTKAALGRLPSADFVIRLSAFGLDSGIRASEFGLAQLLPSAIGTRKPCSTSRRTIPISG